MIYPLIFKPIIKERVWGGRNLEHLYKRQLPPDVPIGESWEISDRPGAVSVIANGPLAGKDLRWVMEHHEKELLGDVPSLNGRFPLLVKILDAQTKLSLQVHPPSDVAARLGGEPKTEMWYVTQAEPGAEIYLGLRRGVKPEIFKAKLQDGSVAECFHNCKVQAGDAIFLPSGRIHAIGDGLVIFEIQQNSDTTYRVFDWNRVGLDGKPRELHVAQALESIDFNDFEPSLVRGQFDSSSGVSVRQLVDSEYFSAQAARINKAVQYCLAGGSPWILGIVAGALRIAGSGHEAHLQPGQFCLVPACVADAIVQAESDGEFLLAKPARS